MFSKLITQLMVVFLGLSGPLYASTTLSILIDPGHGGNDQGAVRSGVKEAEIVLSVAKKLKAYLDKDPLFKAQLTREKDLSLSLEERVSLIEQTQAQLLISIHANAAEDSRARGFEIYFQNHLPPDEDALMLANIENQNRNTHNKQESAEEVKSDLSSILEDLHRNYKMMASQKISKSIHGQWSNARTNAIRQAPFYVISKSEVPSVLIELGYLSNAKEIHKLTDETHQKQMAERIYKGLRDFALEKLDFSPSTSLD